MQCMHCIHACLLLKEELTCHSSPYYVKDGADDGIEEIRAGGMILRCFQTRTGAKFVITAEPNTLDIDHVLREIYVLYADCALKDPFYELEMPIRCELFTQAVDLLVERVEKARR
jgi:trafficking protein particle complex subunit 4